MSIEHDIQESIQKNLPAHVGDVLKTRLEKADADAKAVASLTTQAEELRATASKAMDASHKAQEEHKAMDEREAAAKEAERDLRVKVLEIELFAEKRISTTLTDVLSRLVRNTDYRTTVFGTQGVAVGGSPGGGPYNHSPCPGMVQEALTNMTTTKTHE